MSVLKNLESKIAGLVEGTFSRAFRSEVRPVEIARRLSREMEEHKTVSVSRTYVPNEYTVWLAEQDRERFAEYEGALTKELSGYLLEHSRRERLAMLSRPVVEFRTDDRLKLGEFGIQARLVHPPDDPAGQPQQGERGHTMIYSGAERLREEAAANPPAPRAQGGLVILDGKRMHLGPGGAVLGRSRECDIVVSDANISRRHAEIRRTPDGWSIADLGSTNGVIVDGRPIRSAHALKGGERIELGTSSILFEVE